MILLGDCLNIIKQRDIRPAHIITDAPYDLTEFPLELFRSICPNGNIITFCKPENQFFVADEYAFWNKQASPKNNTTRLTRNVEMILILKGTTFNVLPYPATSNQWHDILEEKSIYEHQKPLSLIERLVRIYTNPGDLVLDPYCGVGTTNKACRNLGRECIGIEKDSVRYSLAKNRNEQPK